MTTPIAHPRHPAVPVATSFAVGIAWDRYCPLPWTVWALTCFVLLLTWFILVRKHRRISVALTLLAACVCLGGARHHAVWSVMSGTDLALYATTRPKPVRVKATVISQPYVVPATQRSSEADWTRQDRTVCTIRVIEMDTGRERECVSGRVRLDVIGRLSEVAVGDVVWVFGNLSRPRAALNPGEFDFSDYLRRKQIGCLIRSDAPECVVPVNTNRWFQLARIRSRFREKCDSLFTRYLSPRVATVARALLLGSRSTMNDELRKDFAESGTMHLLAISGLHVGILAGAALFACRLLHLSTVQTTLVVLIGIGWYAFVTDARPPVVRASILVLIAAAGMPWYRQAAAPNTLAIAALLVLFWNPTDLFDTGAQLSFLAVAAILRSTNWQRSWTRRKGKQVVTDPRAATIAKSGIRRLSEWLGEKLVQGYIMTASIWLFTAPLVASQFHLVSPIGIILNVLLIPLVMLALWLGYGMLCIGLLVPAFAYPLAFGMDCILHFLLAIVDAASTISLGHLYVPGPPAWWLVGFYVLLAIVISVQSRRIATACLWRLIGIWFVVGLGTSLAAEPSRGCRCTFMAVGHGCSVLVEAPNGKTLLYDAGAISKGSRAREVILGTLWERGLSKIDTLVISHADVDHFNAVPDLLRMIPVGSLLVARQSLDFRQSGIKDICDAAAEQNVPIQVIWSGDQISLDAAISIDVLHPSLQFQGSEDNENSVVLNVEFAGRRILLTGDLTDAGLMSLMNQPSRPTDVLLSPHHGSATANPPELAEWAQPRWVVCSKGRSSRIDAIRANYDRGTIILSTSAVGAVTADIDTDGEMRLSGYRTQLDTK